MKVLGDESVILMLAGTLPQISRLKGMKGYAVNVCYIEEWIIFTLM